MQAAKRASAPCARVLTQRVVVPFARAAFCVPIRAKTTSSSPYSHGKHRSNAEVLVNQVPVIEVDGHVAVCDGGSGALGHPVEYIQLDTVSKEPQICKYCGLRYKMKHHH